jgi:hypothetical protein
VDEDLPLGLREGLPPDLRLLDSQSVMSWPRREGAAFLRLQPLLEEGPYVRLGWRWTVLQDRAPEEAPRGHVQGATLHLMATDEGWRLVEWVSYIG